MRFSTAAVAACCVAGTTLLCSEVSAFAPSRAFVSRATAVKGAEKVHKPTCACPSCSGVHQAGCACAVCARVSTLLFSTTEAEAEAETSSGAETAVPAEVEAMDGIASADEAHNADRPARESLKKKRVPKGKPLSEFAEGDSIKAKVKTITSYGAFMDFGATTDGLLHISRVASGFVKDVNEVLTIGQEVDARILSIDTDKNQVALTLLTEAEEEQAADATSRPKKERQRGGQQQQRRDDGAILKALQEKGWESEKFVEGKVVSTVAFGAFVRVDASLLNPAVEGEMDGLVHISSLSVGRADSVTGIVNVGDTVQVRCKGIQGGKVSLSMIASEDEQGPRGGARAPEGAKDWKEQVEKFHADMPDFTNRPAVVDLRK